RVKPNAAKGVIYSHGWSASQPQIEYELGIDANNNGKAYFEVGTAAGLQYVYTGTPIPTGVSSHLAGTYNSTTGFLRIYLNGQLSGALQTYGAVTSLSNLTQIGNSDGPLTTGHFGGTVKDVYVYGGELTSAQVQGLLTTTLVLPQLSTCQKPPAAISGERTRDPSAVNN